MNLESNIEFPPLGATVQSPSCIGKINASTPLAPLNSSLNPMAEVFTPKSATSFSGCIGKETPEEMSQLKQKPNSTRITRSKSNKKFASEMKSRFFEWKECGRVAGKRRYSMISANTSFSSIATNGSDPMENENDPDVLKRREKNIKYGKNTDSYQRYIQAVPRELRVKGSPRTPIKDKVYSRRQWDGLVKHWKIHLHNWERELNGEISQPTFSTPKRAKTKCDRRSLGTNISNGCSPVRNRGDMLPPQIKIMAPSDNELKNSIPSEVMLPPTIKVIPFGNSSLKEDTVQDDENSNEPIDWSLPSIAREVDWSKECDLLDEESEDGFKIPV